MAALWSRSVMLKLAHAASVSYCSWSLVRSEAGGVTTERSAERRGVSLFGFGSPPRRADRLLQNVAKRAQIGHATESTAVLTSDSRPVFGWGKYGRARLLRGRCGDGIAADQSRSTRRATSARIDSRQPLPVLARQRDCFPDPRRLPYDGP